MKRIIIVSLALMAFATATRAAEVRNADVPKSEISTQLPTAEEMFHKAQCYMTGEEGYTPNEGLAAEWMCQAAEKGHIEAQNIMGYFYAEGYGVKKDDAKSIMWYTRAAESGHARAQNRLGKVYDKGLGVAPDEKEAAKWYRLAAEQGDSYARKWLKKKGYEN